MKKLLVLAAISIVVFTACKPASKTAPHKPVEIKAIAAEQALDFSDTADFVNARRGFIATLSDGEIKDDKDNTVYSLGAYDFLKEKTPDTANPSLWRQSQLNAQHGLFEVVDGIYQVRGFDLSNMTLIKGETGWIIIDPLITKETANAALELANAHLGPRPVSAVVFTHSHIDHYGGIRGITKREGCRKWQSQNYSARGVYTRNRVRKYFSGQPNGGGALDICSVPFYQRAPKAILALALGKASAWVDLALYRQHIQSPTQERP